jgi:hypothetical protein
MAGLYNDGDALRLEHFGEGKADLLCEPFLDLKSPREHFDYSSDLGEAMSDGEDAALLVYLVNEEKDIYIGVLVVVCHLATRAQPSCVPRLPRCRRIYTNIRHRHSTATVISQRV